MKTLYEEAATGGGGAAAPTINPLGGAKDGASSGSGASSGATEGGAAIKEAFWKGLINEDGTINPDRFDHLPDDIKDSAAMFKRYKTAEDWIRSDIHGRQLISRKGLTPLREDASEAELAEFNATLKQIMKVPDKPEGYGIKRPEGLDEKYWDQGYADKMAGIMHANNLSPTQVKSLVEANQTAMAEALAVQEQAQTQQLEQKQQEIARTVAKEWGPQAKENIEVARRTAKALGIDPDSEAFLFNPEIAFAMEKVSHFMKESSFKDSGAGGESGLDTAEATLKAITGDPANPHFQAFQRGDETSPAYKAAARALADASKRVAAERERKR